MLHPLRAPSVDRSGWQPSPGWAPRSVCLPVQRPNEMPFIKNAQPVPTVAMTKSAAAGPTMRAALYEVELSETALGWSSSPTSSATNVCRTGASIAAAKPNTNANTRRARAEPRRQSSARPRPEPTRPCLPASPSEACAR
jgi:hypothetical protein